MVAVARVELTRIQSRIVSATVFSERAHVTRRAPAPLVAGLNRIAIEDLPASLDPSSLRVSATRGLVRFVETDEVLVRTEPEAAPGSLAAAIKEAETKLHRLMGEVQALTEEIELVDRVTPVRPDDTPPPGALRPEVFVAGLDAIVKRRREALHALRAAQYEQHFAGEALEALLAEERELGNTAEGGRTRAVLVVGIEADDAGEVAIDLTYTSGWATWRPFYNLRLDGSARTVEVVRFADVWQETGEDWPEVNLFLSTAEPEEGLSFPTLLPWTLETRRGYQDQSSELYSKRRQSAPAPKTRSAPKAGKMMASAMAPPSAMPMGEVLSEEVTGEHDMMPLAPEMSRSSRIGGIADGLEAEMDDYAQQFEEEGVFASTTSSGLDGMRGGGGAYGGAPPEPSDRPASMAPPAPPRRPRPPTNASSSAHPDRDRFAREPSPRKAAAGIDFELEVGGKTSCKSGRDRHRASLGSAQYPAKIEYLLRPAIRDHGFGRVTVTNGENVPLLGGPAAIFVRDAFYGTTQIETTPAGGKLILDLGAETSIKCARRSKTTVRTEGIIAKDDIHVVEVNIDVESFLSETADLEIQDQVPVSNDPKVRVRLMQTSPKDASLDDKTGILTFRARVGPLGRTQIAVLYEIEVPKDYRIVQSLKAAGEQS